VKEVVNEFLGNVTGFLFDLLIALIFLFIGFKIVKILEGHFRKEDKFKKIDKTVKIFIINLGSLLLKVLLILIAATIIGIPTASLITVLGSCALAVGLALQGGLSNLAGGVMILIFKPFKVGDYIETCGKEGTVKSISMFYTTLTTADNKEVQLPNGNLSNSEITNYTANPKRRLDIDLSVSYNTKIDKVKKVINEVINNNEYVLKDEDNIIRLNNYADSALVFTLRVWVKREDYKDASFALKEECKEAFDKNKIEIPYPQMEIHNK